MKLCLIYLYIPALKREELQGIVGMNDNMGEADLPTILAKWEYTATVAKVVGGRWRAEMNHSIQWDTLNRLVSR